MAYPPHTFAPQGNPFVAPPGGPVTPAAQLDENFAAAAPTINDTNYPVGSESAIALAQIGFDNGTARADLTNVEPETYADKAFLTSEGLNPTALYDQLSQELNARRFSIKGDYVQDDTAYVQAMFNRMLLTGLPAIFPRGRFKITGQIILDMSVTPDALGFVGPASGLKAVGMGHEKTVFDMRGTTTYPNFVVLSTAAANFPVFEDLGWIGDQPGYVFGIGGTSLVGSEMNFFRMVRCKVQNFNTTSASRAMVVNGLYGGYIDVVCNCGSGGYVGGQGVALTLRQSQFVSYFGSYGSAEISVQFIDGANAGNVFHAIDMENVSIDVDSASGTVVDNVFISGRWAYSTGGLRATVGSNNEIRRPYIGASGGATDDMFINGTPTGWTLVTGRGPTVTSPAVPASGATVTNTTARNVQVFLRPETATISSVVLGGITLTPIVQSIQLELGPEETIILNYSAGTPTWTWRAAPY